MSAGNPKNFDDHQLKELRVALPKMKLSDNECQPSTSSTQVQDEVNAIAGELAGKKLLESDDSKSPKMSKDAAAGDNLKAKTRKGKPKSSPTESKGKELKKPGKSGSEESPKKKALPKEKKNKIESDKSTSQTKEKGNTPKGKEKPQEKKVSGTPQEKKTPAKADESHDFKDIKDLLREDPTLPPGWRRIIKGKHVGTELKPVVCIASPEGRKFYFKARLREYLEKTNSQYSIDDFYFGLYEKSDKDKAENKSANSDGKQGGVKKSQKQKRGEAGVQEHETKKIRLDSGSGQKKGQASKSGAAEKRDDVETLDAGNNDSGDKNLLLEDPNLPEGWTRKVVVKDDAEARNKIQVFIISPDGKQFARKSELHKYLQKTRSHLDINQFYFGIYPRKGEEGASAVTEPSKKSRSRRRRGHKGGEGSKKEEKEDENPESSKKAPPVMPSTSKAADANTSGEEPMHDDPNLPPGWRRSIKVRTTGESAGRMEVIIMSPDGKRHRSRAGLEQYIKQKGLDLNADDFDFTVYGKNAKKQGAGASASSASKQKSDRSSNKKRGAGRASDAGAEASAPEETQSRESAMINYDMLKDFESVRLGKGVSSNGAMNNRLADEYRQTLSSLMLSCGMRDLRSERRLRIPKLKQEQALKEFLDSVGPEDENACEVPASFVKKLALCRSDLAPMEEGTAETVAKLTTDFLKVLAQTALESSEDKTTLEYDDIAEVVDKCECMAPFRSMIPKKVTYNDYKKSNRQTKFSSFT